MCADHICYMLPQKFGLPLWCLHFLWKSSRESTCWGDIITIFRNENLNILSPIKNLSGAPVALQMKLQLALQAPPQVPFPIICSPPLLLSLLQPQVIFSPSSTKGPCSPTLELPVFSEQNVRLSLPASFPLILIHPSGLGLKVPFSGGSDTSGVLTHIHRTSPLIPVAAVAAALEWTTLSHAIRSAEGSDGICPHIRTCDLVDGSLFACSSFSRPPECLASWDQIPDKASIPDSLS